MDEAASASGPLLDDEFVDGAVDYSGQPVSRSRSGGWRSACFIIGVEMTERFAYYGIASNLISYLTGPLHQSIVMAAENVNVWSGVASMLPLLGAVVADSCLGRYRMIVLASLLYILCGTNPGGRLPSSLQSLCLLTLSAVLLGLGQAECADPASCPPVPAFRNIFFFVSLYLVAFAQGGHKPCVQAFGADQFDNRHSKESKSRSSFFNWWYFGLCGGTLISLWIINYVQDDVSWGLGFGIPCISMATGLLIFLLGTKLYRHTFMEKKYSFPNLARLFITIIKHKLQGTSSLDKDGGTDVVRHAQFKYLDGPIAVEDTSCSTKSNWNAYSASQGEGAKAMLRLFPIWSTCLIYAVVFAQSSTFFTKQGSTMNREITSGIEVPAATLQSFISLSIVLFIPIYDRLFVPFMRSFTGMPSGITMLQRIGTGMLISAISMVAAAVVERWRLAVARESAAVDDPHAVVPMSVWWLVPQYVLFGVADVFTMVGLQEFFYDQVPEELRSFGLALYLSIFGVGSFLSGLLIWMIDEATKLNGRGSWFASNLNRGHLDYFYWLLTGFSIVELGFFALFASAYVYRPSSHMPRA